MSEEITQGLEQGASANSSQNDLPASETQQQTSERMLPQSEVNRLIGKAKAEAAEKASQRYQQQQAPAHQNTDELFNKFNQTVEQQVNSKFESWQKQQAETAKNQEKQLFDQQMRDIANSFNDKLSKVDQENRYEDFAEVVKSVNFNDPKAQGLVACLNEYDNAGDMMYRLASEPQKLYQLSNMVFDQPNLAMRELKRLSDSVQQNETAKNQPRANAPLSQLKTSNNVGSGGNDWDALRNSEYLRG